MPPAKPLPKVPLFVAAHVAEAYGPQHALREHLIRQGEDFAYAACPFEYSRIPSATLTVYARGQIVAGAAGHLNLRKGWASWWQDARFVAKSARSVLSRTGTFIGFDNLNAAVGLRLKRQGRCGQVVYYVVDYTPRRFESILANAAYQWGARFAARGADQVWSVSERIRQVNLGFGAKPERSFVVPIGLNPEDFRVLPEDQMIRKQLVMVSTLFESKGVQLAIDAMTLLPDAELVVIGTGPYASELEMRARHQGVAKRVRFLGMLKRELLLQELSRSWVALAPYQTDPANYTHYADPAKPKEYLACGIPVVITRVPWIAGPIAERPMGLVAEDNPQAVAEACRKLLDDLAFWRQCRAQALDFVRGLDWSTLFTQALGRLK
jgi:glycosyltransferase involved in cell wall biosynthesis